jgi:hypothetical protein
VANLPRNAPHPRGIPESLGGVDKEVADEREGETQIHGFADHALGLEFGAGDWHRSGKGDTHLPGRYVFMRRNR